MTGATVLNGGLAMDTNKFTVADGSGNTGTLPLLVPHCHCWYIVTGALLLVPLF